MSPVWVAREPAEVCEDTPLTTGLLALLDDIAAIAKVAAASLDDAAAQAAKAGSKAAGIVIDDAAVTPRYVVGLAADRELPIIRRIAIGSLRNKLVLLLPGALLLSWIAPWALTPLLMIGGAFLCYEGFHKVADLVHPHAAEAAEQTGSEDERVASAIRTDFILSAEIMAIALAVVAESPVLLQGVILAAVGAGMTVGVYGVVALIVKADDAGLALARSGSAGVRGIGRAIVLGMPLLLKALSVAGMLAMLWVGGGIILHGLHGMGVRAPEDWVHHAAESVARAVPAAQAFVQWFAQASMSGIFGLAVGAICAPMADAIAKRLGAR